MPSAGPSRPRVLARPATVMMAFLAIVLPLSAMDAPGVASAATKNVNFDGIWHVVDSDNAANSAVLTITNENLTTGTFSGSAVVAFDGETETVSQGQVTGDTFTMTLDSAGLVVGENGLRSEYSGTIDGNTMTMLATGVQVWHNGHPVSASTSGGGTGTREPTVAVSGTVDEASCGDTSCKEAPLAGQDILVTGTASDGSAVSETSTSGDDGSWSVQVPSGSYTAGPTLDDQTIDGRGFDPEQAPVTVDTTPLTDVNFLTCAGPPDSSDGSDGAADDAITSGGATADLASFDATDRVGDAKLLSASEGSDICKASYTVTLKAALPQSVVVDPSLSAPYNTAQVPTEDGYNGHTSTWAQFQSKLHLDSVPDLGTELTYPDCLSKNQVAILTKDQVHLKWYTYLKGPSNLGGVKVPLVWNRSTATVTVNQPVVTSGSLRRVYVIQEAPGFFGKDADPATYQCSTPTTRTVTPLVLTNVSGSKFTVIVYWVIPFNASALQVAQSTASKVADALEDKVSPKFKEAHETYEKLPEWYKVLLNTLAGGEILKGASALSKYETIEEVGELLSHTKGLSEFADEFAGYMSGQYNGFATAINGQFTTTRLSPDSIKPNVTNLKIAVTTDEFPDYSLSITRNGQSLPWTQAEANPGVIAVSNDFGANPDGMLTNTGPDYSKYDSSKAAVQNVLSDTSQMSFFSKSVAKFGSLNGYFSNGGPAALNQLPDPNSPSPISSGDLLTWAFYDQKP